MPALAPSLRRASRGALPAAARAAIEDMSYEVVPLTTLADAITHLPDHARVSVTASPVKTLDATLDVCAELVDLGHRPVPHIAARMVDDAAMVRRIARRCARLGLAEVFCVGGDRADAGRYPDAMALLRELLDVAAGDITTVGVASYPDGHAFITDHRLRAALLEKQELFAEAGVVGHASTQMCFSTATIRSWLEAERAEGFDLPVHLGVPGVVDRTRLMRMGMRLGVGASLRYLRKNRAGLTRLFATRAYDPATLVEPLAADFTRLRIDGIHMFTFNQVAATREWQTAVLS